LAELDSLKVEADQLRTRAEAAERESAKLGEKVRRYRKEAKRELRSINETAISQLHKEHDERKRMAQRIIELEDAILNLSCDKAKAERTKQLT
jgi:F0F1-type ATP synthase membrane subunit b/b'